MLKPKKSKSLILFLVSICLTLPIIIAVCAPPKNTHRAKHSVIPRHHIDYLADKKIKHRLDKHGNPHTYGELLVKFHDKFDHKKLQLVLENIAHDNKISIDSITVNHCSCSEEDVVLLSYQDNVTGNLEPRSANMGDQDGDEDAYHKNIEGISYSHNYFHAPLPHHLNALGQHPKDFEHPDTIIGKMHHKAQEKRLIVAILDSGLDFDHPDLRLDANFALWQAPKGSCYVLGHDFVNKLQYAVDDFGHGTQVTGVILNQLEQSNTPIDIMPLKISDEHGVVKLFDLYCAMNFAVNHGAKIVNISAGWYGQPNGIIKSVIQDHPDVLFICSAGNDGINTDSEDSSHYPSGFSDLPNVISVAAMNELKDNLAEFSNFGKNTVAIAAPGENITTMTPSEGQESKHTTTEVSGTSFSAPYVTAMAIAIKKCNQETSGIELMGEDLKNEVFKIGQSNAIVEGKLSTNQVLDDRIQPSHFFECN